MMMNERLTDEEIDALWLTRYSLHDGNLILQLREFARAVLARAAVPVVQPDSAQWPDQRNRGLLQAAKQALAALDRHATQLPWGTPGYPVPVPGVDLLYEARSHLEPAIRREEEFRAALAAPLARQEPKPDAVYPVQPSSEAATARLREKAWSAWYEAQCIKPFPYHQGAKCFAAGWLAAIDALPSTPAQGDRGTDGAQASTAVQRHITDMLVAHRDMIEAQQRGDSAAEVLAVQRMEAARSAIASAARPRPVAFHDKDQPNGIAWCPGYPEGLKDITPLYADYGAQEPRAVTPKEDAVLRRAAMRSAKVVSSGVPASALAGWEKCAEPGSWHCGSGVMGMTKDYAYRKFDSGWHRLALPPAHGVAPVEAPSNVAVSLRNVNPARSQEDGYRAADGMALPRVRDPDEPLPPDVLVDAHTDRVHQPEQLKPCTRGAQPSQAPSTVAAPRELLLRAAALLSKRIPCADGECRLADDGAAVKCYEELCAIASGVQEVPRG